MVEFMVTDVRPIFSRFKKTWWSRKKVKGFEYASVSMIWAFEDKPDQENWEVHENDVITLHDKSKWLVLAKETDNKFLIRLYNKSRFHFKKESEVMGLYGEGLSIGKLTYR